MATPADAAPQAINQIRSPSPIQKRKSRRISRSALSPNGMDDLGQAINNLQHQQAAPRRIVRRQQVLNFASQPSGAGTVGGRGGVGNNSGNTSFAFISSQISVSGGPSQLASPFPKKAHLSVSVMEKENSNNGTTRGRSGSLLFGGANSGSSGGLRVAPSAPGRRAKRQLPRTSTNPFLPQKKVAGKRSRRRRQPKFPVLGSQDDPVEMSRYLEDFEEVRGGRVFVVVVCCSRFVVVEFVAEGVLTTDDGDDNDELFSLVRPLTPYAPSRPHFHS